jgi:hypothetical protein
MVKTNVAESNAKIRQINLDTDEKIRQINLEFARGMETLEKDWRLSDGRGVKEGDA